VTSYFLTKGSHPIYTWLASTENSPRSPTITLPKKRDYVAYLAVSGSKLLELKSLFFQHFPLRYVSLDTTSDEDDCSLMTTGSIKFPRQKKK